MPDTLSLPHEIIVATNPAGEPGQITLGRIPLRVLAIRNTWRIDDEWWRIPISRLYYELELPGGRVATVFNDLVSGKWFRQAV
jgi:hypothetical protein